MPKRPKVYLFGHSPHLRGEWDGTKNFGVDVDKITYGSSKKYWWVCGIGHSWESTPNNRTSRAQGCPICANQLLLPGYNDMKTTHPELAKELCDPIYKAEDIFANKGKIKLQWRCSLGHSYLMTANNRAQGKGCPVCSNKTLLVGFNDLATTDPELISELCEEEGINPSSLTRGVRGKFWWKCSKNHRYQSTVANRIGGKGCSVCANKIVIIGVNDLKTTHPELAEQLVDEDHSSMAVHAGSHLIVKWACPLGHSWCAQIASRARNGRGCPYCAGKKVLVGFNDLKTTHPDLIDEYIDSEIPIESVSKGSKAVVQWRCTQGHHWRIGVYARTSGSGCPKCATRHTSKKEKALRSALANLYPLVSTDHTSRLPIRFRTRSSISVDICINYPSKIVVEYDGAYFHYTPSSITRDTEKTLVLLENGYKVVRIRETIPQIPLPLLEIKDTNLLQLSVPYMKTNDNLIEAVDQIKQWLESKND